MVDFDVKNTPQGLKYDTFLQAETHQNEKGKGMGYKFHK